MLTSEEVLKKASLYDFEAVKDYLEAGGNKEVYDGTGRSLLTNLLEGYYLLVYREDPVEAQIVTGHEDDDDFWDCHVHRLSRVPLDERPHKIKEQIEYLLSKGIGINAVGWEEAKAYQGEWPCVETPLFQAVVYHDYCMTEYLLKHGADPGQKLYSDGSYDRDGYEDWLLDEMDICILNGDRGDAGDNDVEIAALLMHYGLDQWGGGVCIHVDRKTRTITGHEPKYKF